VLLVTYNIHFIAYVYFSTPLSDCFGDIFGPTDLIVQDHRFDLVENFGCSASVDPSAVGVALVWIPPLLMCSLCFIFFGLLLSRARMLKKSYLQHLLQLFR
jgi:pheromone a factor receptor